LPQPCSSSDMTAATMQYEEGRDLVSGGTAVAGRLCGITDTTARRVCPFKIKFAKRH